MSAGGEPEPEPARWRWLGLLLVVAGVLVHARKALAHPGLPFEDGSVLFQRYYQDLAVGHWFASFGGYVVLLPNVLASLLCRLPVECIPLAFVLAAALVSVAATAELLHPAWRAVAPVRVRVLAAAALAWLPLGNHALTGMLMYSQCSCLWWLCLLVLRPGAWSRRDVAWRGVRVAALAWSHPLAVMLVPLAVARGWRRPGSVFLVVNVGAWLACGREGTGAWAVAHAARELGPYLAARVGFECWFGTPSKEWLQTAGMGWLVQVGGAAAFAGLGWSSWAAWGRQAPATRRFVLALAYLTVVSVALSLLSRGEVLHATDVWGQRYALLARQCFVLANVLAITTLVRWRWAALGLLALVLVLVPRHRRYYAVPGDDGVRAFLAQLAAAEQRLGDRRAVAAVLDRPDWPIRIVPR